MTRVAIIGGGIGGLTAANALSRAGIEMAVYEAAAELREIGAGVALHPNAMKVLRAIGVEDSVREVAGRSQWQVMRNWKTGRVIGRTSREQQAASFGITGATVHRADLLDVLAAALPAGLVTLGKRCTGVRPDGDVAVARFADGSEIEADIIVGADGIHSPVRASLFGPDAPRFTGKICYRSVIPTGAVRGARPGTEGCPVAGPARHDRPVPAAGRGTDQRRLPLRRRHYRHESWIAECGRQEVLDRYAGWHESLLRLFAAARHLVQVGALRPRPDPAVDARPGHRPGRRRASDAPLPRPGRLPGDRGRRGPGDGALGGGRRSGHGPGPVRAHPPAESEPGGARRPRARAEQPPDVPAGRLAARSDDRVATAGEPARPGGARRGLARRLRRELAGRARQLAWSGLDLVSYT